LWQCTHSEWLFNHLLSDLLQYKPIAPDACVGVFTLPTLFLSLSDDNGRTVPVCSAIGVRCYGFGNTDDEAFGGFGCGVDAVMTCTRRLGEMVLAAIKSAG
jgi:hypothetical protein